MSGRYALFRWSPAFAALHGFPVDQQPHWSIAPGASVLLLRQPDATVPAELAQVRWGLTPAWLTDLTRTPAHARSESVADQPMFRDAFRMRRGLLPANGFYEWRGNARKQPFWMTGEGSLMYFAAIWEAYPVQGHCYLSAAMLTVPAANQRRPLILDEAGQAAWLAADTPLPHLHELLAASRPPLRERALATFINDPALDSPHCLTPLNP